MQKLRLIHLYLGCLFAPMLVFFALSGIWQMYGLQNGHSRWLAMLSTIHTGHIMKLGGGWRNWIMRDFILAMAVIFIVTTILGVIMALKYGRRQGLVICCLAAGVLVPVAAVVMQIIAPGR